MHKMKSSLPKGPWTKNLTLFPASFCEGKIIEFKDRSTEGKVKPHLLGYRLFKARKVKNMLLHFAQDHCIIKSEVDAAMKKCSYQCVIFVDGEVGNIQKASCSCMGGISGRCKHIFAILYQILDFLREEKSFIDFGDSDSASTSQPRTWDTGSERMVVNKPFEELNCLKPDPLKKKKCTSDNLNKRRMMLNKHLEVKIDREQIEVLSKTLNDNDYNVFSEILKSNNFQPEVISFENWSSNIVQDTRKIIDLFLPIEIKWANDYLKIIILRKLQDLHLINEVSISLEDARKLEKDTRCQTSSKKWHLERSKRITSSKFSEIVKRSTPVNEKLISRIWPKRDFQSSYMKLGLQNEESAMKKYKMVFPNYDIYSCGLIINPGVPFLAASPDRLVFGNGNGN